MNNEQKRVEANRRGEEPWEQFGPYLSERAWGTVREDYSPDGSAWDYFPHDHARSRVFRWSEDGIGGISDDKQRMCFALAFWNGSDPILKERLFGLTGPQGNHGEDVKENYFYLDSTPTHSYMKMLYKYPQAAFPYSDLVAENARRTKHDFEYELFDTGVFNENRYFDIFIEYAKASPNDILIRVDAVNRGPEAAELHLLPTLWFRNTWAWGYDDRRPDMVAMEFGLANEEEGMRYSIKAEHFILGNYYLHCEFADELFFTNNETNTLRLYGVPGNSRFVKDGINDYLIYGNKGAINPNHAGTKAAAHYHRAIEAGETCSIRLRLTPEPLTSETGRGIRSPFEDFDDLFNLRKAEADEYYKDLQPASLSEDEKQVQRQALGGMLWSKQFYHYIVEQWLKGDPAQPPPPPERLRGRNWDWKQLYNERVHSMPDKWEYPWYAAWDLAFHCIPLSLVDSHFAKSQLELLMREWYQHPNGAFPAYEWNFNDVNPPVFAWAAWRVYKIEERMTGRTDRAFLESLFHKLLINFTWWVNRKDSGGNNIFEGGFLGLDNIGIFDRSRPNLPTGGTLEQSDATSWMGMFCLNMLRIALELARTNPVYEDIASKFFEHFLWIAAAMNDLGDDNEGLWDPEDEFFYDMISLPGIGSQRLKIHSLVGLIPLFAVETIEPTLLNSMPGFRDRLEWYLNYRPDLAGLVSRWYEPGEGERRLLAMVRGHRMKRLLRKMLDPNEFLSDYGVRSLSKYHEQHPYSIHLDGMDLSISYQPAESNSGLFGGNSNWRGPVWFPINYLLIESLQRFHHYYGDDFKVECPTGSGNYMNLDEVANELSNRLIKLFIRDQNGCRPFNGANDTYQNDPNWRDHILFNEYFHGDNGAGIGASHQTGWTGLVAKLIQQQGTKRKLEDFSG